MENNSAESLAPQTKSDVQRIAELLKSKKKIVIMSGAGISTAAGIPDFRSSEGGLYNGLNSREVFSFSQFKTDPEPFYTLVKRLIPEKAKYTPTLSHCFMTLLSRHGLLHQCITQNVDTLERLAGVPGNKIIEAHGSLATQRCITCKKPFSVEDKGAEMRRVIRADQVPKCDKCGGTVKSNVVLFGEGLPFKFFFKGIWSVLTADMVIIMGTSLQVYPFAILAYLAWTRCTRVLINRTSSWGFGNRKTDVHLRGDCDAIVVELAKELGWEDELKTIKEEASKLKAELGSGYPTV